MIIIKRRHGQGLVEMALVLPLFLVMVLAIYDFGVAFHTWITLNQQCVEAAKVGATRLNHLIAPDQYGAYTHAGIAAVRQAFDNVGKLSRLMRKENYLDGSPIITGVGVATTTVTVSARYKITLITPLLSSILLGAGYAQGVTPDGELILSASAQMIKE